MDRLVYTALSGMQRQKEASAVTAHNLANAEVSGFRRALVAQMPGWLGNGVPGPAARVQAGAEAPHDLLRAGRIERTGDPLHVAPAEGVWIGVADALGATALTRRGDFRLAADGTLETGDGRPALGDDGQPIRVGAGFAELRISDDGSVATRAAADQPLQAIGRLLLARPEPETLRRGPDGLFRTPAAPLADEGARVLPGAVEGSNVDAAGEMVALIEQARRFELQSKLIGIARELDRESTTLMRVE